MQELKALIETEETLNKLDDELDDDFLEAEAEAVDDLDEDDFDFDDNEED